MSAKARFPLFTLATALVMLASVSVAAAQDETPADTNTTTSPPPEEATPPPAQEQPAATTNQTQPVEPAPTEPAHAQPATHPDSQARPQPPQCAADPSGQMVCRLSQACSSSQMSLPECAPPPACARDAHADGLTFFCKPAQHQPLAGRPGQPRPGQPMQPPQPLGENLWDEFGGGVNSLDPTEQAEARGEIRLAIRETMKELKVSLSEAKSDYKQDLAALKKAYDLGKKSAQADYKKCLASIDAAATAADKADARADCRDTAKEALAMLKDEAVEGREALADEMQTRIEDAQSSVCDDISDRIQDVLDVHGLDSGQLHMLVAPGDLGPCGGTVFGGMGSFGGGFGGGMSGGFGGGMGGGYGGGHGGQPMGAPLQGAYPMPAHGGMPPAQQSGMAMPQYGQPQPYGGYSG